MSATGGITSAVATLFVGTAGYAGGNYGSIATQVQQAKNKGISRKEAWESVNYREASINGLFTSVFSGYSVSNFGISSFNNGTSNAKFIRSLRRQDLISDDEMMKMMTQDGVIDTLAPAFPSSLDGTISNIASYTTNDVVSKTTQCNVVPNTKQLNAPNNKNTYKTTRKKSYRRYGGRGIGLIHMLK
jgi:hypothetical protein